MVGNPSSAFPDSSDPSTGTNIKPGGIPDRIDSGLYVNPEEELPDLAIIAFAVSVSVPSSDEPDSLLADARLIPLGVSFDFQEWWSQRYGLDLGDSSATVTATIRNIATTGISNASRRAMPATTARLSVVRRIGVVSNVTSKDVEIPPLGQGHSFTIAASVRFDRSVGATYTVVLDVNPERSEAELSFANNVRSESYLDFPGATTGSGFVKPIWPIEI